MLDAFLPNTTSLALSALALAAQSAITGPRSEAAFRAFQASTSYQCLQDTLELESDPHILALTAKIATVDNLQAASLAGVSCAQNLRRCPHASHSCCSADYDWSGFTSDLHGLAAAIVANGHGRLCFTNYDITVTTSGLTLEEHFGAGLPIAIGKSCTAADSASLLSTASTTCALAPNVGACNITWESPTCGAGSTTGGGRCTDWQTLSLLWQYCDAPGASSGWGVDISTVIGPDCRHGHGTPSANGCCYVPLGYNGGPEFGSDCEKVCAAYHREGSSDAYCGRSDRKCPSHLLLPRAHPTSCCLSHPRLAFRPKKSQTLAAGLCATTVVLPQAWFTSRATSTHARPPSLKSRALRLQLRQLLLRRDLGTLN